MFLDFIWTLIGRIVFFTGAIGAKNSFPKPLSKEEEEKYLQLVAEGDKEAKEILIKHNMRLVAHIVKKYSGVAETDDLISVGSIGLIKAINTYRAGRGTTLATYTARCIENEILMLLRADKKTRQDVSLQEPIGEDKEGNTISWDDILVCDEEAIMDQVSLKMNKKELLRAIQEELTPREKIVIKRRYGLEGNEEETQRQVAKSMGISRSYVSRIEKKALEKLQLKMKKSL